MDEEVKKEIADRIKEVQANRRQLIDAIMNNTYATKSEKNVDVLLYWRYFGQEEALSELLMQG